MKTYEINTTQFIEKPLETVFNFFSKPENLERITPENLSFKVLTPTPIKMEKGALIDYTIRIVVVPIHWRTYISKYDPPYEFVDEQVKGPYAFWHHTHTFKEVDGGVEINDKVKYAIPMGILGRFMHAVYIKNNLKKIFSHRKAVIENVFLDEEIIKDNV